MEERKRRASDHENLIVAGEVIDTAQLLLAAFSHTSAIGFAIFDKDLRYQAINNCLAKINGIPAQAHLGVRVRDLFGEVSETTAAEPGYQRVLTNGETTQFEVKNAVLPTRAGSRYWGLNLNFPIRDHAGEVTQVGILVVDVSAQRKLEDYFSKLAANPSCRKPLKIFALACELQESIEQYHAALAVGLDFLRCPQESTELLMQSVQQLDQRILAMRALVSDVAQMFQIEEQP